MMFQRIVLGLYLHISTHLISLEMNLNYEMALLPKLKRWPTYPFTKVHN